MKASCIRLKLLEVNSFQVSILTIKVFLTYLTYFNQNYFLHSNILSTWGWVYVHIPILLPNGHFPLSKKIMSQHDSNYSTTHIISMGSKLFLSLKYTFHSIYSNTNPYTKHNLQNILLQHTLGWAYVYIPILLPHGHFPLFKKLHHNTLQTIPLHILFQWDQNYFPHSNILSTQYTPTSVHTLNTTYKIIYLNTLCIWFMFTYPFYSPRAISPCSKNYITTQFKLFYYTYYFNGIKIISLTQIYFPLNIFKHQSIH